MHVRWLSYMPLLTLSSCFDEPTQADRTFYIVDAMCWRGYNLYVVFIPPRSLHPCLCSARL